MIELKNVSYKYTNNSYERVIFENLNLKFDYGKFYVILGESGSGKTTFLNIIGGQDTRYCGEVFFNNEEIKEIGVDEYKRKYVGFIYQSYNLLQSYSAVENIIVAMDISKKKSNKEYVYDLLSSFGINKEVADRKTATLSGGEQQRVAIARAIARNNDLIIADEPTGNLDVNTGRDIIRILKDTVTKEGKCLIMVTHNQEIAKEADFVYKVNQEKHTIEMSDEI